MEASTTGPAPAASLEPEQPAADEPLPGEAAGVEPAHVEAAEPEAGPVPTEPGALAPSVIDAEEWDWVTVSLAEAAERVRATGQPVRLPLDPPAGQASADHEPTAPAHRESAALPAEPEHALRNEPNGQGINPGEHLTSDESANAHEPAPAVPTAPAQPEPRAPEPATGWSHPSVIHWHT